MAAMLLLVTSVQCQDQSKLSGELQAINRNIEYDYLNGKVDSIVFFYGSAFTYLPEFRPIIVETGDLQKFYADWFRSVHITSYKKEFFDLFQSAFGRQPLHRQVYDHVETRSLGQA